MPNFRITDALLSELISEWHEGCTVSRGYTQVDGDSYCGNDIHARAREIRQLAYEQRLDDRMFVQHSSDGRTGTQRVGTVWVSYIPGEPGGSGGLPLWPAPDDQALELSRAVDSFLSVLSPEDKELLLMRYQHRIPLRSIGDAVGCSKDTVVRMINDLLHDLRLKISSGKDGTYQEARAALIREGEDPKP